MQRKSCCFLVNLAIKNDRCPVWRHRDVLQRWQGLSNKVSEWPLLSSRFVETIVWQTIKRQMQHHLVVIRYLDFDFNITEMPIATIRKLWPISGSYHLHSDHSRDFSLIFTNFASPDRTSPCSNSTPDLKNHGKASPVQEMDALALPTAGTYRRISATQDVLTQDIAEMVLHRKLGKLVAYILWEVKLTF